LFYFQCDLKLKAGDLIEIFRKAYSHWALYVGNGYVIHLTPPSEYRITARISLPGPLSCSGSAERGEEGERGRKGGEM